MHTSTRYQCLVFSTSQLVKKYRAVIAVLLPAVGIEPTSRYPRTFLRRKPYTTGLPKYLSNSIRVDESSLDVADYLLGQYDNFLQFAGQKDGATRCAQIVQLLLANHVDHDASDPLVAVQLDASNAFCSVSRQPQFDVLAGKASRSYDDGRVQVGDELPRPRTLDKYWGYFLSMQGIASTMRFSDNQGVTHHLPCSKGGQQDDGLETIRFAVTVHPSIGRVCVRHLDCKVVGICDDIFIVVRLSKALSCAAEMKKIS